MSLRTPPHSGSQSPSTGRKSRALSLDQLVNKDNTPGYTPNPRLVPISEEAKNYPGEVTLPSIRKLFGKFLGDDAPIRPQTVRSTPTYYYCPYNPFSEGSATERHNVPQLQLPTKTNWKHKNFRPFQLSVGSLKPAETLSPSSKREKVTKNRKTYRNPHPMDGRPCTHCNSLEKTPEWRSGPYGRKHKICNACGLFYLKLKAKFGERAANLLMHYRKTHEVKNRKVPSVIDIPHEFIVQLNLAVENVEKNEEINERIGTSTSA
ncbi:uncharacterized protein KNAG_0M01120 [Huiozyma naganishii CBS 8797]|uniref:GATA-type domain-containing protein n=1 Tax=Huiozyma naganishii (strain ATCC MYA-139 / BCRC 22969 / CBS 8797 / KCTC 17520 / NBRC 10181 / NCYC 3082 / Yp74L-3) TaxID=1071383 RepID=J7RDQ7_HUIN7|nr:hypothetical protein KNAG_0M01120 [Kazachstania naganishii CBS 8797]CCK72965.1 hypothetical protein KNAG_0M01120 [Kazachstania naganishii CBS 8797]